MSFSLDVDTKERVRAATDIVDLIGSSMELRRQGRNFTALCPWHSDRRPSLQINPERQIWKCWVCDIGGDVFNWVMKYDGVAFGDALKLLAERAGIALESSAHVKKSSRDIDDKPTLYRVMAWASRLYHQHLIKSVEAHAAREYLVQRGITEESIARFELGLAPESWSYLIDQAQSAGYNSRLLEAVGLTSRGERGNAYDCFRDRLMFPIRDKHKNVIAFGGRILPGKEGAKYINSRETKIFSKNQNLYGFNLALDTIRERRQAIVMEGYTDVIVAHQAGLSNAVAVLGTALGVNHLKLLRHICDQVILLLDGDEAGQKRSSEVLELFLNAQMDVRILTLPDQLDPADFLLANSSQALVDLTACAPDALEFKMRRVCEGFDPVQETHRANVAIEQMLALLAKVPRGNLIDDQAFLLRRNQVLARLAKRFMVTEDELRNRLRSLMAQNARTKSTNAAAQLRAVAQAKLRSPAAGSTDSTKENPNQSPSISSGIDEDSQSKTILLARPSDLSPIERELLELMIASPNLAPMVLERILPEWIESIAARKMLEAYNELELEGNSLEFESVLVTLEDPSLKSLLVTLFEQAQVKQKFVKDSPEQRLRVLTQRMGQRQEELQRRRQLSMLENGGLDDEAELNLLNDFIRQARQSQGLDDVAEDQASIS